MGWLVQAEAHPGALFRAFRKVILDRPQAPQLQGAENGCNGEQAWQLI